MKVKKILCLAVATIIVSISLIGCKSKAERELEDAQRAAASARKAAEEAQRQYDQLQKDLEEYNRLQKQLENAK